MVSFFKWMKWFFEKTRIEINYIGNEIIIKGNQLNLIKFENYVVDLALSKNNEDYINIYNLTLTKTDLKIDNLIIEKKIINCYQKNIYSKKNNKININ